MFTGLSFLNLSGLLLSLAAPLLILAYLRKSRLSSREVPSLFLLSKLPEPPVQKRKLRLPLRFFLELLCLLILALVAAWPVLKKDENRLAVLIDNSLSMEARNPSGQSSLDLAREEAEKWINQSSASTVDLFTSAPSLRKLASLSPGSLKVSKTSDNLPAAVTNLAEKEVYNKILVLSDRQSVLSQGNQGLTGVETKVVGEPSNNLSISDFSVSSGQTPKASLVVRASGAFSTETSVRLEQSNDQQSWSTLAEKTLSIDPGQSEVKASFSLEEQSRFLRASLSADERFNSIASDDLAWTNSSGSSAGKTLLVSPDFSSSKQSGLDKLSSISVDLVGPDQFSEVNLEPYSQLIFHKSAPSIAPRKPSLLILPPEANPVFPVQREIEFPKITSWKEDHPVMSYLRVPLLKPVITQVFEPSPWASEVLNVEQGSILLTGESQGIRFIGYGSELLPFEGKKTPSTSILLLNSLSWLSGGKGLTSAQLTGTSVATAEKYTSVRTPSAKEVSLVEEKSFMLEKPGGYEFEGKNGKKSVIFANSFFPEESNTAFISSYAVQYDASTNAPAENDGTQPLWRWFCIAFLIMVSLDFIWRQFDGEMEGA